MMYHISQYNDALYITVLWCIIYHSTMMYYISQYYDVLYITVLWCIIYHSTMMYYISQYYDVLYQYSHWIDLVVVQDKMVVCKPKLWHWPHCTMEFQSRRSNRIDIRNCDDIGVYITSSGLPRTDIIHILTFLG